MRVTHGSEDSWTALDQAFDRVDRVDYGVVWGPFFDCWWFVFCCCWSQLGYKGVTSCDLFAREFSPCVYAV